MHPLLSKVESPSDLTGFSTAELEALNLEIAEAMHACETRAYAMLGTEPDE